MEETCGATLSQQDGFKRRLVCGKINSFVDEKKKIIKVKSGYRYLKIDGRLFAESSYHFSYYMFMIEMMKSESHWALVPNGLCIIYDNITLMITCRPILIYALPTQISILTFSTKKACCCLPGLKPGQAYLACTWAIWFFPGWTEETWRLFIVTSLRLHRKYQYSFGWYSFHA